MDNLKTLLGTSIQLPEVEEDDDRDVEDEAEKNYEFQEVIDNIGKSDFQEIYLTMKNIIQIRSLEDQVLFCRNILSKLLEVYDIDFPESVSLFDKNDIRNVYDLLEFIEYDNLDFVSSVWRFIKIDLRSINIKKFCKENENVIFKEIQDQIETHSFSPLIYEFLRTYNKSDFVDLFVRMSEKNRMLIVLRTLGGSEL